MRALPILVALVPVMAVSVGPLARATAPRKQVVAHRGASAYAPEHTIEAYRLAIEQGADYVEQDLAVSKDGVLVCIHDLTLERTTDVEAVFPGRAVNGRWHVADFTLAELKRLDAGSWFDGKFATARIPTFQEAIDLVRGKAGMYPELKDPAFYRERGVSPEQLLAAIVRKNGLGADPRTPLILQSFDAETIRALGGILPGVPRVWLVDRKNADWLGSEAKVRAVAAWASGLGPHKEIVAARPDIVKWAHAAGLTVTPYTFRASNTGAFRTVRAEMEKFLYEFDVDAVFTDNPDQFPRR